MNAQTSLIGDADLHAYVDGKPDQTRHAEVEAWLSDHGEDCAKVDAWKRQKTALHAHFDGLLEEPFPEPLQSAVGRDRTGRPALV